MNNSFPPPTQPLLPVPTLRSGRPPLPRPRPSADLNDSTSKRPRLLEPHSFVAGGAYPSVVGTATPSVGIGQYPSGGAYPSVGPRQGPVSIVQARPSPSMIEKPALPMSQLRPDMLEKGMVVQYDGGCRGWVDNLFASLNEFWIRDEQTGEIVFTDTGHGHDIRCFRASELTFTGEWSRQVEVTEVVDVALDIMGSLMGTHYEMFRHLREQTCVNLRVEAPLRGEVSGKLIIGPGPVADVRAAKVLVMNQLQGLVTHYPDNWLPDASLGEPRDQNMFPPQQMCPPPLGPSWLPAATPPAAPGLATGGRPSWLTSDDASALTTNLTPSWLNVSNGADVAPCGGDSEMVLPPAESTLDSQRAYQMGWEAAMRAKGSTADQTVEVEGKIDTADTSNASAATKHVGGSLDEDQKQNNAAENAMTVLDWAVDQAQFADLPQLREGWIRIKSKTTGRLYYLNTISGKTTFTAPVDLPPGWVQMTSRSTGKTYFWNEELQKSQFVHPGA